MTEEALDPETFLASTHADPVDAATVAALRAAFPALAPAALAHALERATALNLAADPLGRKGTPLDAGLIAGLAPRLESLDLSRRPLRDPEALGDLTSLRHLRCAECEIKSLSWISALEGLTELDVSRNHLTQLSGLRACVRLEHLKVASNLIDDISPLAPLRQLRSLDLSENALRDLTPLQDARQLRDVNVRNNGLRTLHPLGELGALERVACGGNPLGDDDYDIIPRSVRVE